jgi:hypothetical protein
VTGKPSGAPSGGRPSDAILDRLLSLHPKIIDLTLDRVLALLAEMGDPQQALPPVVHIAGTNGKGSTLAMVRAGIEATGKRVHAYTSPHLARFHERIRIAGSLITEVELAALLEECERVNGARPITFFEIHSRSPCARASGRWLITPRPRQAPFCSPVRSCSELRASARPARRCQAQSSCPALRPV